MKQQDYPQGYRREPHVQIEASQRSEPLQKPQAISAPGMMQNTWKRYADSRLKQFSTR
jgi:hypothetical protein